MKSRVTFHAVNGFYTGKAPVVTWCELTTGRFGGACAGKHMMQVGG